MISEIIFMQIRIVRLFCKRLFMKVSEVNKLFNENNIYEMINNCYDAYHCSGDEIVYNDVLKLLKNNGAIA